MACLCCLRGGLFLAGESRSVFLEPCQFLGHQRVCFGVDVGEGLPDVRVLKIMCGAPDVGGELIAVGLDLGEESVVSQGLRTQVLLKPGERILGPPRVFFVGVAVLGGIVGSGVGTNPVGEGLDQDRALARAGVLQCPFSDGVHPDDVVAVHADAGKAVALGPVGQRNPGLDVGGHGNGPVVVLAEEDHGRVVGGREDH